MVRYLIKKALLLLLSLYLVATLTFFLMKILPGDPFTQERAIPEEILKAMYRHYGLDKPLFIQYLQYLKGIVTFDLGPSFKYEGRTVNQIIASGLPVSMILGLEALTLALFGGVTFGAIAAIKRSRWQDSAVMCLAVIGISVPSFIMATFLQYIFAMKLGVLPVALWGSFSQSILPALSLAALPLAFIARLTRSSMVEVLEQDYILTARARGLAPTQIFLRHMLRNGMIPVVTYLGGMVMAILTGSFVVEKIFGIPGLGRWFVDSISNRDYPVIMGMTVFYSALLMVAVLLVDILYCIIDPRIQLLGRDERPI